MNNRNSKSIVRSAGRLGGKDLSAAELGGLMLNAALLIALLAMVMAAGCQAAGVPA